MVSADAVPALHATGAHVVVPRTSSMSRSLWVLMANLLVLRGTAPFVAELLRHGGEWNQLDFTPGR